MKENKKNKPEKLYLKILGVLQFIGAFIFLCGGILTAFVKVATVDELGLAELRTENISDNDLLMIVGCTMLFLGLLYAIMGWLLFRAANHPEKSTFLLVLLVISVVCGIVSLFNAKGVASALISTAVSLTIDVLALMAVMRIRREIE